jgi:hypothetical protein
MFAFVGSVIRDQGVFCLYGPFNEGGDFSSDSNRLFDQALKEQDEKMGIRDLDDLQSYAHQAGMALTRRYAMPANNQIAIWSRIPRVAAKSTSRLMRQQNSRSVTVIAVSVR